MATISINIPDEHVSRIREAYTNIAGVIPTNQEAIEQIKKDFKNLIVSKVKAYEVEKAMIEASESVENIILE